MHPLLLTALIVLVSSGAFGRPALAAAGNAPWWAWIGGILGALFVTTTVFAVPRVGTVATFGAIICGQFIGAVLIDTHGWLGVTPIPLDAPRVIGVPLLVAGVLLIHHRQGNESAATNRVGASLLAIAARECRRGKHRTHRKVTRAAVAQ